MIEEYIKKGLIERKKDDGLVLYNYTRKCNVWDEVTMNCRGHVYDEDGNLVANTFPKFFNLFELSSDDYERVMNADNFTVTEKVDGSLGIVYFYKKWRVNTRGSFDSPQAKHAYEKIDFSKLDKKLTYIVEIVYPENKIQVDYGDKDEIYLLTIYEGKNELFELINRYNNVFSLPKTYKFESIEAVVKYAETVDLEGDEFEGFVVRLADGYRVKIKTKNYYELKKLDKKLNTMIKNGKIDMSISWPRPLLGKIKEYNERVSKKLDELMEIYKANEQYADKDNKWLYTHLDKTVADVINYKRKGGLERYAKKMLRDSN